MKFHSPSTHSVDTVAGPFWGGNDDPEGQSRRVLVRAHRQIGRCVGADPCGLALLRGRPPEASSRCVCFLHAIRVDREPMGDAGSASTTLHPGRARVHWPRKRPAAARRFRSSVRERDNSLNSDWAMTAPLVCVVEELQRTADQHLHLDTVDVARHILDARVARLDEDLYDRPAALEPNTSGDYTRQGVQARSGGLEKCCRPRGGRVHDQCNSSRCSRARQQAWERDRRDSPAVTAQ